MANMLKSDGRIRLKKEVSLLLLSFLSFRSQAVEAVARIEAAAKMMQT